MITNLGTTDRVVRIALAIVFGVLFLTSIVTGIGGLILLLLAAYFLLTSFLKFCPIYAPFDISSGPKR